MLLTKAHVVMRELSIMSRVEYLINAVLESVDLSDTEKEQLGKPFGKPGSGTHYVTQWNKVRQHFQNRSSKRNPNLDSELTAYTPGETRQLMKHPKISDWHDKMRNFTVPEGYHQVAFVPCAATKPWGHVRSNKSIYGSYNRIKDDIDAGKTNKKTYFVTVSEPLGVVPQEHWDDFPQYDNPGLFKDHPQRAGMFTKDWKEHPREKGGTGHKQIVPFDHDAYNETISHLGKVIGDFVSHNKSRNPKLKFMSFVDNPRSAGKSTHTDMLDHAETHAGDFLHSRHEKRAKAREIPEPHLRKHLGA